MGHSESTTDEKQWSRDSPLRGLLAAALAAPRVLGAYRLAILIFLVPVTIGLFLHERFALLRAERDRAQLLQSIHDQRQSIQQRMGLYESSLRGAASFYAASSHVDFAAWTTYVESLGVLERLPGVHGVGLVLPVGRAGLSRFLEHDLPHLTRGLEGAKSVRLRTVAGGDRPDPEESFIIPFVAPLEPNRAAVGLDLASEKLRREAAEESRDRGLPIMTEPIVLVQDMKKRPGFLLYAPVYRPGLPLSTVEERRHAHLAWAYAPFVSELFIRGVLGPGNDALGLHVFTGDSTAVESRVFDSDPGPHPPPEVTEQVLLGGRLFTFDWHRKSKLAATGDPTGWLALGGAVLVGTLLGALVVVLQTLERRAKALAEQRTRELSAALECIQEQTKRIEEALLRAEDGNRAKSAFLANMSHEIRTPLNGIIGVSHLLLSAVISPEHKELVNTIKGSGDHLLTILDDILDLSKIEAGKVSLEVAPFDVKECVANVVSFVSSGARNKGLALTSSFDPQVPARLVGDAGKIRQIVLNFVSNAVKFTERGEVRVLVGVPNRSPSGPAPHHGAVSVRFEVLDTGAGIPWEAQAHIFETFRQAEEAFSRKHGGTGLGLAIARQLTQLLGGEIGFDSEPGKGSRFWLTVPLKIAAAIEPAQQPNPKPTTIPTPIGAGLRLLVADDNAVNRKVAAMMLERLGCHVESANDGREAIAMALRTPYDVIFMDCQMPEVDGFEATQTIRQRENTEGRRTPIVALTANAMQGDRERCLAAGMDDHLPKPVRPDALAAKLAEWTCAATGVSVQISAIAP